MMNWAILGTGMVARKFASDLRLAPTEMRALSVASRRVDNAQSFARDLGIPHACETFAQAVATEGVDAVYIATPPSVHEEHALLAIAAGTPVLIEKPFAADAPAARRIMAAAADSGVFCMEAMWTRFLPVMDVVRTALAGEGIGTLRTLAGSFGISSDPSPDDSLFDPVRGGGALLHRGIYPLSLAHQLMGPVRDMTVAGRLGTTGVDEECSLILRHENDVISTITASLRAPAPNDLTIGGTHGALRLVKPVYRPFMLETTRVAPRKSTAAPGRLGRLRDSDLGQQLNQRLPAALRDRLEKTSRQRVTYTGHGYHYQAEAVARCLAEGQTTSQIMPVHESVALMELVDAAYETLRKGI